MEWTVSFLSEEQTVVFQTHGVADEESSFAMVDSIFTTMSQYRALRLLIDHREIESVTGNTFEIYLRPKVIREMGVPPNVKIAELVLPTHREHFGFMETVFQNRNIQFLIFNDRESAMKWLTE
jgi:hypothetical protein